jgi:3-hydroxyisobutyrate dehydrogenase-like beta-hydroxyacid dehydrogenase
MSEISMIGLGAMGSALARALLKSGHGLTVWNRSPQKMEPLAALGAETAERVADAVQASPLIMVCIDNYAATSQLLSSDDVVPHLAGRTVIQLGTGTPREARDTETWLQDCGADYLDGAIDSYPDGIGAADGRILFSGSKAAFARSESSNAWAAIFAISGKISARPPPSIWRSCPKASANMPTSCMAHASARRRGWTRTSWPPYTR